MKKTTAILSSLFALTLIILVVLGARHMELKNEVRVLEEQVKTQQTDAEVLEFTRLFVVNVLGSQSEVDFETRLQLENAVRELENEKIKNTWDAFVESENEAAAQQKARELLMLLVEEVQ